MGVIFFALRKFLIFFRWGHADVPIVIGVGTVLCRGPLRFRATHRLSQIVALSITCPKKENIL